MLGILNFIGTPIGKGSLLVLSIIAGILFGLQLLKIHDSNERETALVAQNVKQLEQSLQNQTRIAEKLNTLMQTQEQLIKDMEEKNQKLENKIIDINKFLESDAAKKSNQKSSTILKQTIRGISK